MTTRNHFEALGLQRHPFPVAPDAAHFFVSAHIQQVVVEMVHGIAARKGFLILTGEVGLGKTTLARRMLQLLAAKRVRTALVFHTALKDVELLREINRDFGLPGQDASRAAPTLGSELQRLNRFLIDQYRQGVNCAIIIDDAQNLDHASLELLRMISNLEADQQKLVQIVLVGQPELQAALRRPELRQLRSRVAITKSVCPLDHQELHAYITFKLDRAGNQGRITVGADAISALYRYTGGNFRQMNLILDRCLYALCGDRRLHLDRAIVRAAYADLQPENRSFRLRLPALGMTGLIALLMMSAGFWALHLHASPGAVADQGRHVIYHPVPIAEAPVSASLPGPITGAARKSTEPRAETIAPSPVVQFLRTAGLEANAEDFEGARFRGTLSLWAERIYHQSGYRLVQLAHLSEQPRRQYGALALEPGDGSPPVWLVLWQPVIQILRFYDGYQGQEIRALQGLLAAAGHYHQAPHGTVDGHLTQALADFQQRTGLVVSGFPDDATLFLLCHPGKGTWS